MAVFPKCLGPEVSGHVFLGSPELGRTGRGKELLLRNSTSRASMRKGQMGNGSSILVLCWSCSIGGETKQLAVKPG